MEKIALETLDGYQFQQFVGRLFDKLGFVNIEVGPPTADAGIDISMEQEGVLGTIKYAVECKHHPENAIGRPTVQKLHSAVIHSPISIKGLIVTSGHFSNQAIKYASEVGIELIDIDKLTELANKAGLVFQTDETVQAVNTFPLSERPQLVKKLFDFLQYELKGFSKDSTKISEISIYLIPTFMIEYYVGANFSTTVGRIHSINENGTLFVDGKTGNPINELLIQPIFGLKDKISRLDNNSLEGLVIKERGVFDSTNKDVEEKAKHILRVRFAKAVTYYGANRCKYTKKCTPKKSDVAIKNIKKVYVPILVFCFSILGRNYILATQEAPNKLAIVTKKIAKIEGTGFNQYPEVCMICSNRFIDLSKFVCNKCGIITCKNDSSKCKKCGKIICEDHTFMKRRFLRKSDRYCEECAKSEGII